MQRSLKECIRDCAMVDPVHLREVGQKEGVWMETMSSSKFWPSRLVLT